MIYYDTTNAARSGHFSGLQRVSARIRAELGAHVGEGVTDVVWRSGNWSAARGGGAVSPGTGDWLLSPEVFGESEREGFGAWLGTRVCRTAAVYYDAIPLKFPAITWPKSVARHPGYLKQLARFDRVLAISQASCDELTGYWEWARIASDAKVTVIPLGADASGTARVSTAGPLPATPALLMVGIVEPRKNQSLMLDVCEQLWNSGLEFDLHIVGRVNPQFGAPIVGRIKALAARHRGLKFHGPVDDSEVQPLHAASRAAVFPSLAEGNGLPVLEALWRGIPCVCSRIASLEENASGGGCVLVSPGHVPAWGDSLREILTDDALVGTLRAAAVSRKLPTWSESAKAVIGALGE